MYIIIALYNQIKSSNESDKSVTAFALNISCAYCLGVTRPTVAMVLAVAGGVETISRSANGYIVDLHIISAYSQLIISIFITGAGILFCASYPGLAGQYNFTLSC